MKKVLLKLKFKTILTVVLFLSSLCVQSFASVHALITPGDKKLVIDISNLYGDHATCRIVDNSGFVVFSEKITESNMIIKKYDLSKLDLGYYVLTLEDDMSIETIKFELTEGEINYSDRTRTVYKPTIIEKSENLYYLNQLALNKEVKLEVSKNGEYYFSETYINQPTISKKIDLTRAEKGEYLIKVSILGETFYNTVSI